MKEIICIIGPSGSGKTTLVEAFSERYRVNEIVSHTTRERRPGERSGVDYHFITEDQYLVMDFVERVTYAGNRYGLARQEVDEKVAMDGIPMVVVTLEGYQDLKAAGYNTLPVILILDRMTQEKRLIDRGDDIQTIEKRLALRNKDLESQHTVQKDGGRLINANVSIDGMVRQLENHITNSSSHSLQPKGY